MKRKILWCLKALLSGILAFVIVSAFCTLYYNLPVHSNTSGGATDYNWEGHVFYSRGTEGFAWGQTNNEGYLNPYDYTENTEVDILVMGFYHANLYRFCQKSNLFILNKEELIAMIM